MVNWIQYAIMLRKGKDAGLKRYVNVPVETVISFLDNFKISDEGIVKMGHIVGQKKGQIMDEIYYNKKSLGSLVFNCENEQTANKCAEYWKFSLAF